MFYVLTCAHAKWTGVDKSCCWVQILAPDCGKWKVIFSSIHLEQSKKKRTIENKTTNLN